MKVNNKEAKLPKKLKEKWVKALVSSKYIQGQHKLHNLEDNTWCCLGVLCNVVEVKTLPNYYIDNSVEGKIPIPEILHGNTGLARKLAEMNDSGKWSFKRIASYIERYL